MCVNVYMLCVHTYTHTHTHICIICVYCEIITGLLLTAIISIFDDDDVCKHILC